MRYRLSIGAATIALLFGLTMPAANAWSSGSQNIQCGATILQSITLNHNLFCSGTALILGPGLQLNQTPIVVDLGGHTVSSSNAMPAMCGDLRVTIYINQVGVTLKNGRIVAPAGATGVCDLGRQVQASNLILDAGEWHERPGGSNVMTLRDSTFLHGAAFVATQNTTNLLNDAFLNGPTGSSAPTAISISQGAGAFASNFITGYGTGMSVGTTGGTPLTVRGNVILHSGIGIDLNDEGIGTIEGNLVVGSQGDGIFVHPIGATTGLVDHNVVLFNGGDGIHFGATFPNPYATQPAPYTVTATANVAIANAKFGIETPGSTYPNIVVNDGGGNVALLNGATPQCLNITCTP